MRAMQSSHALEEMEAQEDSNQFAALHYVSRRLDLGIVQIGQEPVVRVPEDERWVEERRKYAGLGIAEGAGLAHDVGNLLGALSLYSELLAIPGVLSDGYGEYAEDLRMLSERSQAMVARLVDHAR